MPLALQCSELKVAKTLADAIDQSNGTLGADVGVPLVAIAELVFGAYRSQRREENLARVAALRQTVHVLPVTVPAVPSAGAVARAHRWRRPLQCDNS
jgi:predicted nucleic acid-binding protein